MSTRYLSIDHRCVVEMVTEASALTFEVADSLVVADGVSCIEWSYLYRRVCLARASTNDERDEQRVVEASPRSTSTSVFYCVFLFFFFNLLPHQLLVTERY